MNAPVSITAPLDTETLAKVEELARARGITGAAFAAEAIREAAREPVDFASFVQAGIASLERGEVHGQNDVAAWFEERVAARHGE